MSEKSNLSQKIFIIWFFLLTLIAGYNFMHNLSDQANAVRYEKSIQEHETFKEDINYLKGQVDTLSKKDCSTQ